MGDVGMAEKVIGSEGIDMTGQFKEADHSAIRGNGPSRPYGGFRTLALLEECGDIAAMRRVLERRHEEFSESKDQVFLAELKLWGMRTEVAEERERAAGGAGSLIDPAHPENQRLERVLQLRRA